MFSRRNHGDLEKDKWEAKTVWGNGTYLLDLSWIQNLGCIQGACE